MKNNQHPCQQIYSISQKPVYGDEKGICRITGTEGTGINFNKWVKDTFTDIGYLNPGTIISNEAAFCFDEASKEIQEKTGRDKLQRFRTYSHIIHNGTWYCLTKANKDHIFNLICDGAELVCLTDSGQKHLLFKHKLGMWQLDETYIQPNIKLLKFLHTDMCELMRLGFSQAEIITGKYISKRIVKSGIESWKKLEDNIKAYRGSSMMDFTAWMLFIDEESKQKIQDSYKKQDSPKPVIKTAAQQLF